jgi:hypothetical protein
MEIPRPAPDLTRLGIEMEVSKPDPHASKTSSPGRRINKGE